MLFERISNDNDDDHSIDSELTFDFESFFKTMDSNGVMKMTHDEKVSRLLSMKNTQRVQWKLQEAR